MSFLIKIKEKRQKTLLFFKLKNKGYLPLEFHCLDMRVQLKVTSILTYLPIDFARIFIKGKLGEVLLPLYFESALLSSSQYKKNLFLRPRADSIARIQSQKDFTSSKHFGYSRFLFRS